MCARAPQANPKSRLGYLVLSSNLITHAGAATLADALAEGLVPSLTQLDLSWNKLAPEGGEALRIALESLQADDDAAIALCLRSCGIDLACQVALKEAVARSAGGIEVFGLSDKAKVVEQQ